MMTCCINRLGRKCFWWYGLRVVFLIHPLNSSVCHICQVLEGKPIYADCFGNLVPLTKSGQHHLFSFFAFKENRLALFIKVSITWAFYTSHFNSLVVYECFGCYRSETTLRSPVAVCPLWKNPGTTGHLPKMPYATSTSPSHHTAR